MPTKPILIPITALSLAIVAGVTAAASRTTKDGAFTSEQAERGRAVYDRSCKNCHQAEFYAERLPRYANKPVTALFDSISTTMPADNVGTLLTSEYVDVLAYVFSITGSPAGKDELSTDNMESINIAKPE